MLKKRIAAGIAALLMAFGTVPLPQLAGVLPCVAPITAQAAQLSVTTGDGMLTATVNNVTKTITLQPAEDMFADKKLSKEITFDLSEYQDEIMIKLRQKIKDTSNFECDLSECIVSLTRPTRTGFDKYVNLAQVTFKGKFIQEVGANLFSGCTNLQFVDFGSNITSIGSNAFSGCTSFVGSNSNNRIQLNNVKKIGQNAFLGCTMLEHINFNGNVEYIDKSAFKGCKALKEVEFPNTLTFIGDSAFSGCIQMNSVTFDDDSDIEEIGSNAFNGNSMLKDIDFGYGTNVKVIKTSAFAGNTMLQEVRADGRQNTLPAGIEYLGAFLFNGDTSLQNFIVPDQIVKLPSSMFSGCTALRNVYFGDETGSNSVCDTIGSQAFYNCKSLTAVCLPESTVTIGSAAFSGCTSLERVVVSDELRLIDGMLTCDDKALGYDFARKDPSGMIDPDEKSAGNTFASCPHLSIYPRSEMDNAEAERRAYANKVKLPVTVNVVPEGCFAGDTGLTDIDLGDVCSVGNNALKGCTSLTFISFPPRVRYLNKNVLAGCTSLKDMEISGELGAILDGACNGCSALETMTPTDGTERYDYTLQFPASCGGVQNSAFTGCKSFKYINILKDENGRTNFGTIGTAAFKGCESIEGSNYDNIPNDTLSLPEDLMVIQASAFEDCKNIGHIVLNGDVSSIAEKAFSGCTSLESIRVSDTVKQIGSSAFKNCTSLHTMPETEDGAPALSNITVINSSTFEGCKSLESVFIPSNIRLIDSNAFKNCTNLAYIQWEQDSGLETIGEYAFSGCSSLALFSDITEGEDSVFPDSLITIKKNAFEKCGLINITLIRPAKSGNTNIVENNAFSGNTALKKADLSSSNLASISDNMFSGCTALTNVVLPDDTVSSIGSSAFANCYYLHTFGKSSDPDGEYVLPESVVSISSKAFANNYCMQHITFPSTIISIDLSMFNITINESDLETKHYTPIEYIDVSEDNVNYSAEDGVLYNKNKSILYNYPVMKQDEIFTVPESVETIGSSALAACYYLKGVEIHDTVSAINDKAMMGCRLLEFVDFTDNYTTAIGTTAFSATGTESKKVLLYGAAPCTAKDYALLSANSRNVTFVDAAAELDILDKDNNSFDSMRLSTADKTYQLNVEQTNLQGNPSNDLLQWTSSDTDVAEVDSTGSVTMKKTGSVTITVTNGRGTVTDSVELKIFEKLKATLSSTVFTYDGTEKKPDVTVMCGSNVLTEGTDYTLEYRDNIKVGTGKVIIKGMGDYPETLEATFKINRTDISKCEVILTPDSFSFDGTEKRPAVTVKNGSVVLTQGTDYSVSFRNNKSAGTATVTIRGIGSYSGSTSASFEITKPDVNSLIISLSPESFTYDGSAKKPAVTVKDAGGKTLKEGTDYKLAFSNNINAGTASVEVTGLGGYQGKQTGTFTIAPADISAMTATLSETGFAYDGTEKKPSVTISGMNEGTDFDVAYSDNIEIGKAAVHITGKGNYTGTIDAAFDISQRTISGCTLSLDFTEADYTGDEITPAVTVLDGETPLTEGVDFTVTYSDNVEPGTAAVTIEGTGNYSGTLTGSFTIKKDQTDPGDPTDPALPADGDDIT
ncbi:leucine-rich repeat protein, partial [uncultured Ruminococcus sp.]|uniref:leucine-rich repeat protein n=1 Tax=uncultured Ruminococcus sp. TaxID=165186 RepID=UPI0025F06553